MPELPEVEVICRGLAPHLEGQRLVSVSFGKKKLRLPMPTKKASALLRGETISSVKRRAKYIIITLGNSAEIVIHLGMTGRLGIFPQGTPTVKHDHACWLLDNQMELRFNDTRRFGSVQITGPDENHNVLFSNLGPDPFWDSFSGDYLNEKARKRTLAIKNFLMDNRVVTGIGNIYVSEILFATGINPSTPAGFIELEEWQRIVSKSREILADAISQGGTTISDYVNSSGEKGYFQVRLKVYGRQGQPCHKCAEPIQKTIIGGRASFFCPHCQPLKPGVDPIEI
ncbi:MAG: bifunctional DNA-formamidopyrimidine glycosylase/DNA-(apurinic or apyrimidinic site) lyase [Thermodesulfobacteriota bacterium]